MWKSVLCCQDFHQVFNLNQFEGLIAPLMTSVKPEINFALSKEHMT